MHLLTQQNLQFIMVCQHLTYGPNTVYKIALTYVITKDKLFWGGTLAQLMASLVWEVLIGWL